MSFLFVLYVRERRFLKKKTYDTMRPILREELDEEIALARERKAKFDSRLKEAEQSAERNLDSDDIPTRHN
jgi:hypothetical protein